MTSPVRKRPAVTYQRRSTNKITEEFQSSALLNPDAALQEKINSVLFGKNDETTGKVFIGKEDDDFDSAYHETMGNAKKVHDLVQSGETRRFIDEIDYLLDGIQQKDDKSIRNSESRSKLIVSSLEEIIEKCFDPFTKKMNVNFSMKLKSHGALSVIFDSLLDETDGRILGKLLLLVVGLLYDVRRMDFFFKPELAIKLVKYCFNGDVNHLKDSCFLRSSQLFLNQKLIKDCEIYDNVGVWILYKWSFSSLTSSKNSSSFLSLLKVEFDLLIRVMKIVREGNEKAAGLLDYLIINGVIDLKEFSSNLMDLFKEIISKMRYQNETDFVSFMKLAVTISGSPLFGKGSKLIKNDFFELVQSLSELINCEIKDRDINILALSCLINLIDRCNDSFIDEFRYQKYLKSPNMTLLEYYTNQYSINSSSASSKKDDASSLIALLLGFICRQNRTNLQVMLSFSSEPKYLKNEIFTVASNFYRQQENNISKNLDSEFEFETETETCDSEIIIERLNEIIFTFKQN